MMVMLLDDDSLDEEQQEHLAVLASSAMKQAHSVCENLKGRKTHKAKYEGACVVRDEATTAVMRTLPQLLTKFKAEATIIAALLQAFLFDLERASPPCLLFGPVADAGAHEPLPLL
jgi:hypothetical protein